MRARVLLIAFLVLMAVSTSYAGTTERVSVDSFGIEGNNESVYPSISSDGRYVAFASAATNLVQGDTNGAGDIFVYDRQTGVTERVSVDSYGNQANHWSISPSISADGRYVAFTSMASNLAPGTPISGLQIFLSMIGRQVLQSV